MAKIIVSGSIAYDRIMDFPGLFKDHFMVEKLNNISVSFHVDKLTTQFGGTAGNIAYNLGLLGVQAEIIATAGRDFGSYRSHMMLTGIDPASIHTVEDDVTASAYVITDKADNQIAAFHGGAGDRAYDIAFETDGAALGFIAPGCVADMQSLPSYYRTKGLRYLYDPAQQMTVLSPEAIRDGVSGALLLFGNDYEYAVLKEKTGWSEKEILSHVDAIIVTNGAKGTDIVAKNGTVHVDAAHVDAVVDPTGAGDGHRAGFMKGMVTGLPYDVCAKIGSTIAAYIVEVYGTQSHKFTLEDLKARYKKNYQEELPL